MVLLAKALEDAREDGAWRAGLGFMAFKTLKKHV